MGAQIVEDLDVLNGTPLLDLKPYVPEFDHRPKTMAETLPPVDVGRN
jgi:tRNA (Thr-GGU) A37 N-methylase